MFYYTLAVSRTVVNSCGLGGLVYVDAMFADDGVSCHATLSDWNPFDCEESDTMVLSFRSCSRQETVEHQGMRVACKWKVSLLTRWILGDVAVILN